MDKRAFAQQAEEFLAALMAEYFDHGAGLKQELQLSPIYERHARLFSLDTAAQLVSRRDGAEDRHLAHFAATGFIEQDLRHLTERIATAETQATVPWDGKEVPFRQAPILISNEPDRIRRNDLHTLTARANAALNPDRLRRLQRSRRLAQRLGFADCAALSDRLAGLDLPALSSATQALLSRTRTRYRELLHLRLEAADIPPDQATTADFAFLRRGREFDSLFPGDRLLPALEHTLAGLGIALREQPNVALDVEERPLKSPRAFCAPVRVPGDVRLAIRPRGGHDDFEALFHEAGHLEHFAHVSPAAPFAYRCLGDNSVTEAYAFLLAGLITNSRWLRDVLGVEEADAFLDLSRLVRLFYLRRYAAKLAYEVELHRAPDPAEMPARYAALLGDALALQVQPESYLSDVDDFLYCACYLRAWVFEVQLRRWLTDAFGEGWFQSPEAGARLCELWALGQQHPADELARRLGFPGLDPEPLIEELLGP